MSKLNSFLEDVPSKETVRDDKNLMWAQDIIVSAMSIITAHATTVYECKQWDKNHNLTEFRELAEE